MSNQDKTPERPEADARSGFGQSTRRTFLSRLGMASLLATAGPAVTTLGQRSGKVEQVTSYEQPPSRRQPDGNPFTGLAATASPRLARVIISPIVIRDMSALMFYSPSLPKRWHDQFPHS